MSESRPTPSAAHVPDNGSASHGSACGACGATLEPSDRFCANCQAPLSSPAPAPPATSQPTAPAIPATPAEAGAQPPAAVPAGPSPDRTDPLLCQCGQALPPEASFCWRCGVPVARPAGTGLLLRCLGDGVPAPVPLAAEGLTLGKEEGCGLVVRHDPYLSREHARLEIRDGQVLVHDLNSSNGTYLRVARPMPIEPGDELVAGHTRIRLEADHG